MVLSEDYYSNIYKIHKYIFAMKLTLPTDLNSDAHALGSWLLK